jgi:hypothetical protein
MKISLLLLLTISINSIITHINKKELISESDKYELSFIGNNRGVKQLRDEYICSYPIFINIVLDSSYKFNYPNPCSPSMINRTFIFRLSENSDIKVTLIDSKDSIYFDMHQSKAKIGYYYFQIKQKYLSNSQISRNAFKHKEFYRIVFLLNNKKYELPLSKI